MKKYLIAALLMLLCVLFIPVSAFANSAQRRFEGITSNGTIVTDADCPVQVTSEQLTFNISDFPVVFYKQTEYNSNVTAEYAFYNPADYDVNMQLVFPFGMIPYWSEMDYIDADKYCVYVDGVKIERGIRAVYSRYDKPFNLSEDMAKISDSRKSFIYLSDDTPVYKYVFKSEFSHSYENSYMPYARFATNGLTLFIDSQYSFSNDGSYQNRVTDFYGDGEITVYSVGEQLSDAFFNPTYHVEVYDRDKGDYAYTERTIQGATSHQYLGEGTFEDVLFYNYNERSGILRDDYYNALVDKLGKDVRYSDGAHDLSRFDIARELMLWYQYDVSVPSKQTVINKVIAPTYPTVDGYFTPSKYHYEYLLSPAASWASFANLDVTINTTCYMSNPSLEGFVKTETGYKAHFDSLPKGELQFSLCESENPEEYKSPFVWFIVLFFVLGFALFVLIVGGVLAAILVPVLVYDRNRKKKGLKPVNARVAERGSPVDRLDASSTATADTDVSASKNSTDNGDDNMLL